MVHRDPIRWSISQIPRLRDFEENIPSSELAAGKPKEVIKIADLKNRWLYVVRNFEETFRVEVPYPERALERALDIR